MVRANKLESCYVRPIAFYGSEKMGVSPKGAKVHVAIAAWPWGAYLGADGLEKGIRVKTSSFARHHVNVSMCRAKYSGTYANSILANMEATEHGYDEGLLLDVDGFVAEGAGENLFMVKNSKIFEPELNSALIGITRESVIQLAADLGYTVQAETHHPGRSLYRRRSVFYRYRRRSDANTRSRWPHGGRRETRPADRKTAGHVFRRGQRPFDLKAALARQGFTVRQPVLYRALAASELPPEALSLLKAGKLDGAILMSPRTARIFSGLLHRQDAVTQARAYRLLLPVRSGSGGGNTAWLCGARGGAAARARCPCARELQGGILVKHHSAQGHKR